MKLLIAKILQLINNIIEKIANLFNYTPYRFTKGRIYSSYVFINNNLINKTEMNNPSITWNDLDEELQKEFLLNGKSKLIHKLIKEVEKIEIIYEKKIINRFIKKAKKRFNFYYGDTDKFLFECLKKYPIQIKDVAIMGSTVPWYEAIVLSYKGRPFTFEYNKIKSNDNRLTTYDLDDWDKVNKKFDVVLSISSFEHDGLGRYGDPINPDGDLKAMKNVKENLLNTGGILILSVPIGQDCIVFNAHRIYGVERFNKLIEGFELVDSFGFDSSQFNRFKESGNLSAKKDSDWPFQPIFVLKI